MNTLRFQSARKTPRTQLDDGEGERVGQVDTVDHTPYPQSPKVADGLARAKITEAPAPASVPVSKNISFFSPPGNKLNTKLAQTGFVEDLGPTPIIQRHEGTGSIHELLAPDDARGAFHPQMDVVWLDDPKKFFRKKMWDEAAAESLAETIVGYFSRPTQGVFEEVVIKKDGSREVIRRPYEAPIPLLPELALLVGLTEPELKQLAKAFPHTVGRAMMMAKDALKVKLIRGGLNGEMNANFAVFTATNEAGMKLKTEHTETKVDLNELLKQIEGSDQPL